jgi:hypothetical protein
MKIVANRSSAFWLSILVLVAATGAQAGGLSTQLGEVVIENLQVGQTYNLKQLANLRLTVTNNCDDSVALKMDILLPDSSQLKGGAKRLPDTSWVRLSQNTFVLGPSEKASSDIILSIPDDDQFLGQKYQVAVWSHTVGLAGHAMPLGLGLESRVIFTTDTVRAAKGEIVKSSDASVDLALMPEAIFLDDVQLGATYDLELGKGLALSITNRSDKAQTFRLRSLKVSNSATTLTEGYEDAPDASYLRFSENEFALPPYGTKQVKVFVDFPQRTEYCGKRFMFVVHAYSAGEKVSAGVYSRVYASIK